MLKRLKLKFVLMMMSVVFFMLCIIFGMMYHFTKTNLERESINMMQHIAENPFQMKPPGDPEDTVQLPYFTIQTGSGDEIIAKGGGYYDLSDEAFLKEVIRETLQSSEQIGTLEDYNLRFCRVATPADQYLVYVDMSNEQATLQNLLKTSLLIGAVAFLILLGISILLAGWAVRPVDRAWKQQRQFVSDASHELKTPLTVIMTNAELLQNTDSDEADRSMFMDNILAMSRHMRRLLEQMLELSRSDNMQNSMVLSAVNFSKLAEDSALMYESLFFEKGLPLETKIAPDITIKGSEAQLRQILEILLDNAQKYAKPGGRTQVALRKSFWNRCILEVSNEGETIPPEHLKNLFKRFYRADEARSNNGSFGLGLSIAESIAHQHKGKIWAESKNGVNSFFVELPTINSQL